MTKSKYDWQLKYRRLITEKPFMMFFLGLVLTIIFGIGLKGLSQNPDNRIFFSGSFGDFGFAVFGMDLYFVSFGLKFFIAINRHPHHNLLRLLLLV